MASQKFINQLDKEARANNLERNSKKSVAWFQKRLKDMKTTNKRQLVKSFKKVSNPKPGKMHMFFYDPKHKKTLPYYDRFPLIFIVSRVKGGFYGLNLHYLPLAIRASFFDKLMEFSNSSRYTEATKLKMKYGVISTASRFRWFKPAFKKYLNKHVKSSLVEVPSDQWDSVLFLPTEHFAKATKQKVWKESRKIAYGIKK